MSRIRVLDPFDLRDGGGPWCKRNAVRRNAVRRNAVRRNAEEGGDGLLVS
jgi:hypothetical protein